MVSTTAVKKEMNETLTSTKIPSLSNDTMSGSSDGTNLAGIERREITSCSQLESKINL